MKTLFVVPAMMFLFASTALPEARGEKPNIIVILCDDLGYADVGFNGAKDITTPELDRLAKNGTVFTSAYVTHPFCGPSRVGLMTGRYPHVMGGQFNLPDQGPVEGGIPVSETLISTVLQNAGYFTGAIGKWHLGTAPQFHPNRRGFDDFYGFLGGGHSYFPTDYFPAYQRQVEEGQEHIHQYLWPLEHNGKEVTEETQYMTDALSREAVRFVNEAAAKEQPFFLYLSYNAPHTPLEAKPEDMERFASIQDMKRRTYAGMVHAIDRGVGEVVQALKTTGAFDKTLIVFLSDNGGRTDYGADNAPLREGKGSAYEGGYRTPMFFHWPNKVPAGKHYEHPVTALDFYPTFARLACATIEDGKQIAGKDIWDDFLAGSNPRKGDMIYAMIHGRGYSDVGARRGRWKVVRVGNRPWQLFDIEQDIGEQNDLSSQHPERLQELVSQAEQWSRSHTEPRWFDIPQRGDDWKQLGMPKFGETFKIK